MRTSADSKLKGAAPVFSALGDATRLRIVMRLSDEGPLSIMHLAKGARISRQAISKHLQVLERAGLARGLRSGRRSVWELRSKQLSEARHYLEQISREWDAVLDRLRVIVEDERP